MTLLHRRWLFVALLVAGLGLGVAGAHRVAVVEDVFELGPEKSKVSHAIYGTFETGDEVFAVRLTFDEPFALPFEMLIEHRVELEDHRPNYAVVGPGLPAPTGEELTVLPRKLPAGAGVFLERHDIQDREVIFESVMRRTYWSSGPVGLPLLAGEYEVWVFSPDGTTGDFALGFGVEEDFGDFGCDELTSNWGTYAY